MKNELFKRIISSLILIPLCLYIITNGLFLFNAFLIICFFITAYEWSLMKKSFFYNVLGFLFLLFSFYTIYKIRNTLDGNYLYFLFITIICISTDIGGYLFGKLFKGPKITSISPKKTYSGVFGAYFLSITFTYFFLNNFYVNEIIRFTDIIFIFVIIISTVSQLGDILISYFKRLSKIKDTGKIIPGHGGLLDRIDGMIFAFPFSYIIILLNILK